MLKRFRNRESKNRSSTVDPRGVEPPTSSLQMKRSTGELRALVFKVQSTPVVAALGLVKY